MYISKFIPINVISNLVDFVKDNYGSTRGLLLSFRDFMLATLFKRSYFKTKINADKRVVFVFKSNIFRSTLAQEVMKLQSFCQVLSFSVDTHTGKPNNPRMVFAARGLGCDLSKHSTKSLSDIRIRNGDFLLIAIATVMFIPFFRLYLIKGNTIICCLSRPQ